MKRLNKTGLYLAIVFGCVAVFLFPKLDALYLFLALAGLAIFLIRRRAPKEDAKFLTIMIVCIVVTRILLSLLVMEARREILTQDEGLYSKKAIMKVCQMRGIRGSEGDFAEFFNNDPDLLDKLYGYNAYTYLLSSFYYIFGYQIQAARFINTILSILAMLFIFYTAKEAFGQEIAKLSSAIFAFFPSLVLWSISIGTDMMILLCVIAYIYAFIRILKKLEFGLILVMAASILVLFSFMGRGQAVQVLILVTAAGMVYRLFKKFTKKVKLSILLFLILLIIVSINSPAVSVADRHIQENIHKIMRIQSGFAVIDDSGYLVYPAHCYQDFSCNLTEFFGAYFKGMVYAIFAPFPWQIASKLQLMAYPQIILWYCMLPFVVYGLFSGYRKNGLSAFILSLYCFLVLSIFALAEGNVGSLFRHRDMATPFLLIFFAVGLCALLKKYPVSALANGLKI